MILEEIVLGGQPVRKVREFKYTWDSWFREMMTLNETPTELVRAGQNGSRPVESVLCFKWVPMKLKGTLYI